MTKLLSTRLRERREQKHARTQDRLRSHLRLVDEPERPLDGATLYQITQACMTAVERLYNKPKDRPDGTSVSNLMSQSHREALTSIAGRMTHLVSGWAEKQFGRTEHQPIRIARGLTAGGGKTLVAKCWMAAVVHTGAPHSVVYAASEVNALCDVYEDMVGTLGVPKEKIGIYHTLGKKARIPATPVGDLHHYQILLCTHNLIRNGEGNLQKYNTYGDEKSPRDLLIHDESLLVSDAMSLRSRSIRAAHSYLKDDLEDAGVHNKANLQHVYEYIGDCKDVILNAPKATERNIITVKLPDIENYGGLTVDTAVGMLPWRCPSSAEALIKGSTCNLRIVREASSAAAWFVPKVPDALTRVMVLDASYMIRSLTRRGANIERDAAEVKPRFDYGDVEVEYFQHRAGRSYIEDVECTRPRHLRVLAKRIATWISERVPEGERTIVWTFKQHPGGPDIKEKLIETLEHFGVDTDRVDVITHGRARGSNEFAAAKYVAVYGVFEPDPGVTGGHMLGQSKDERADLKDLHDVHSDEVLHELYQELSRGNVRNINRGKAGEMHVFVGGWKVKTLERLGSTQVFHGAKLTHRVDLDSDTVKNVEDDNFVQAARATIEIMRKQSDDKLSAVKIKPLVAARVSFDLTERVWKEAMRTLSGTHKTISLVSDLHVAGWQRQGRSFVKFTSEF